MSTYLCIEVNGVVGKMITQRAKYLLQVAEGLWIPRCICSNLIFADALPFAAVLGIDVPAGKPVRVSGVCKAK